MLNTTWPSVPLCALAVAITAAPTTVPWIACASSRSSDQRDRPGQLAQRRAGAGAHNPSRAAPHARRRASAGRVGVGAPAGGIETVTGGPVRCMNRVERLVGRAGRPSTGASHDGSAQRR